MMTNILSQLQQELQNEMNTAHQLLDLISKEVMEIKELTKPGGDFESKVKNNAEIMEKMAKLTNVNLNLNTKQMEIEHT